MKTPWRTVVLLWLLDSGMQDCSVQLSAFPVEGCRFEVKGKGHQIVRCNTVPAADKGRTNRETQGRRRLLYCTEKIATQG
jgi:hypothetical protein